MIEKVEIKKVDVLVVSVFYNRAELVADSVRSVVNQLEPAMHLILVDDGSTDDTYSELLKWKDDNVTVVSHKNQGFVNSIIQAIDTIQSEYVAIHGSGDVSLAGRFQWQKNLLDDNPGTGIVGCYLYSKVKGATGRGKLVTAKIWKPESEMMLKTNPFAHGEVMFRRSVYEKVGGYRPFFRYAQDRDLWCRFSHHCKFEMIEQPLYERFAYLPGSVSGDRTKAKEQRYLSAFAVYCHWCRLNRGYDPLERDGERAFRDFKPNLSLAYDFFRQSVRSLGAGDYSSYAFYQKASKEISYFFSSFYLVLNLSPRVSAWFVNQLFRDYVK